MNRVPTRPALYSMEARGRMGEPETMDLEFCIRNALALADAAYVEVGRIERRRNEEAALFRSTRWDGTCSTGALTGDKIGFVVDAWAPFWRRPRTVPLSGGLTVESERADNRRPVVQALVCSGGPGLGVMLSNVLMRGFSWADLGSLAVMWAFMFSVLLFVFSRRDRFGRDR